MHGVHHVGDGIHFLDAAVCVLDGHRFVALGARLRTLVLPDPGLAEVAYVRILRLPSERRRLRDHLDAHPAAIVLEVLATHCVGEPFAVGADLRAADVLQIEVVIDRQCTTISVGLGHRWECSKEQ